jgi:hypothetical protein
LSVWPAKVVVQGEEEVDEPAAQADVLLVVWAVRVVVVWQKVVSRKSNNEESKARVRRVAAGLSVGNVARRKRELLSTTVLLSD